jgi:hypothetical protein
LLVADAYEPQILFGAIHGSTLPGLFVADAYEPQISFGAIHGSTLTGLFVAMNMIAVNRQPYKGLICIAAGATGGYAMPRTGIPIGVEF